MDGSGAACAKAGPQNSAKPAAKANLKRREDARLCQRSIRVARMVLDLGLCVRSRLC